MAINSRGHYVTCSAFQCGGLSKQMGNSIYLYNIPGQAPPLVPIDPLLRVHT